MTVVGHGGRWGRLYIPVERRRRRRWRVRDIVSEYASDVDRTSCVRTFTWWRLRGQVDQQSEGCRGKEDVTWHGMAWRGVAWRGMAWCSMGPWRGMAWRPRHGRVVAGDALSQTNLLRGGALAASDGVLKHPRAPPPRARRKAVGVGGWGWAWVVPAAAAEAHRCPHGRGQATHGVGVRAREGYSSWWRGAWKCLEAGCRCNEYENGSVLFRHRGRRWRDAHVKEG